MQDIPALNLMRERVVVIYVVVLLCEVAFVVLLLKRKVGNKIFVRERVIRLIEVSLGRL